MTNSPNTQEMSKAALNRLPAYLRYLKKIDKQDVETVSCTAIADGLHLNSVQVRKDIALVSSVAGKPKKGFVTKELIADLEKFLGYDNNHDAIIVGVGGLGKALIGYASFSNYGLNIAAGFDVNDSVIGTFINKKPILSMDKMPELVKRLNIKIGIIAVPAASGQLVADQMVAAGIKAIWNFANTHLAVPDNVALKNEDLAASLALLSMQLKNFAE